MKVLFLDIDGVCNCSFTPTRFKGYVGIDPPMAARVKRIIAETGCKVVLSSTWRKDAPFRTEVRKKVCEFIDVTPDNGGMRGGEIDEWLQNHKDVERYAILDDDHDFYKAQPLFKTTWSLGLTNEIADEVIAYLNGGDR